MKPKKLSILLKRAQSSWEMIVTLFTKYFYFGFLYNIQKDVLG